MIEKIRIFFSAPVFENEEKNRAAKIVNTLLVSFILLFSFGLTTMVLLVSMRSVQISLAIIAILVMFGLRIPLRRGYVKEVSWILFTTLTLIIPMVMAAGGTVRLPAISLFVLISVIAGLTLGKRAAYLSALVNILIVSGLIWAEFNKYLPPIGEQSGIQQILMFAVSAILTVILISQALESIQTSLDLAKENQNLLTNLNLELEQRVAARTRALETTTEVSRSLSTILDRNQLVSEVVEQVQGAFGYYHTQIYLFNEFKQNLVMVGGTGDAGRALLARDHKLKKGQGLVGRAAESNQVMLIPDVTQAEGWLPNPLLPDTKAEVAVPIAVGSDVLGVLDVQHNVTNALSTQDADLIQTIANQVAIAVQNAQAYTRSQRQAVREAQITAINQRIQSAMTIEDVLQIAVSELGNTLGARSSNIDIQVNALSLDKRN